MGAAITLLACVWGAFYYGKDILHPPFLYNALFVSWIAGIAMNAWANLMQASCSKIVQTCIKQELDNIVVDVGQVSQRELERIIDPDAKKETKKPKVEIFNAEKQQINS